MSDVGVTCIIPARMASERFPGKCLASETGKALIVHVVDAARAIEGLDRVVVATDDGRIERVVRDAGGECVRTLRAHENGTSRLGEAAEILGLPDDEVVVNVQGDEPEIEGDAVVGAIAALREGDAPVATSAAVIARREDHLSPDVVKVVLDGRGRALYFSRAPIPYPRSPGGAAPLRHIGLYVYRRWFLERYAGLEATPLERSERLEQLRVLEHGFSIAVHVCERAWSGIDTPEQYAEFVRRYRASIGA